MPNSIHPHGLTRALNFCLRIVYNFYNTNGTTRAGSLAFTMLLSFIPSMIAIAGLIGKLPYSNRYITTIEQYFFTNYLPHDGVAIYQHVKVFLQQSNNLSSLGFSSLLITSFFMLLSIENQLNGVWSLYKYKYKFNLGKSLLLYIMFISIGFVSMTGLLVMSIYSHIFLHSALLNFITDKTLANLVTFTLFLLCYKIMPARHIKSSYACLAGLVATVIFMVLKKIFVLYTTFIFVNYHIIYGSLAAIPIGLVWVYINCLNFLFCAEIILAMEQNYNRLLQAKLHLYIETSAY